MLMIEANLLYQNVRTNTKIKKKTHFDKPTHIRCLLFLRLKKVRRNIISFQIIYFLELRWDIEIEKNSEYFIWNSITELINSSLDEY